MKWIKKSPTRKESGVCFRRRTTLAEHFDHESAYREESDADGDRRNGRNRHLLLPPMRGGTRRFGKGRHNALLDAHRRNAAAEPLALGVDSGPELNLRFALDLTCAHHIH